MDLSGSYPPLATEGAEEKMRERSLIARVLGLGIYSFNPFSLGPRLSVSKPGDEVSPLILQNKVWVTILAGVQQADPSNFYTAIAINVQEVGLSINTDTHSGFEGRHYSPKDRHEPSRPKDGTRAVVVSEDIEDGVEGL